MEKHGFVIIELKKIIIVHQNSLIPNFFVVKKHKIFCLKYMFIVFMGSTHMLMHLSKN